MFNTSSPQDAADLHILTFRSLLSLPQLILRRVSIRKWSNWRRAFIKQLSSSTALRCLRFQHDCKWDAKDHFHIICWWRHCTTGPGHCEDFELDEQLEKTGFRAAVRKQLGRVMFQVWVRLLAQSTRVCEGADHNSLQMNED